MEIALRGIGVSPGIAIGPALTHGVISLDIPKYKITDTDAELKRFKAAVDSVRADLESAYDKMMSEVGKQHAEIFRTHIMMAEDPGLHDAVDQRLQTEGYNVEYLVESVISQYAQWIKSAEDPIIRGRTQDIYDVGNRILSRLLQVEPGRLAEMKEPSVVIAHDLSPGDTAGLDLENTLGLATDLSGPTSHTAILARALELPAVVGLKYVGQNTQHGDLVIVDGARGDVILRPTDATLEKYRSEQKRQRKSRLALLKAERDKPSVTLDGYPIPVMANIELPIEIQQSLKTNAQGVGLYRTEYLFLNRSSIPTEDEQYQAYSEVASAMAPAPVTLRTLDLGGDKFASHLHLAQEINPQLGWRAIRFCLERPDIFKAQLRAMLRASIHGNVQIMFPLISGLDELMRVKAMVQEVRHDLERRSVPFDRNLKVGSMIEVPSAVAVADMLAAECDFFSIGTNDLIQYSLAVDRVNEKIAHMYEPAHPAVLRMIHQTVKAAKSARIPCGLCGEMAGDPLFTQLLIGLGIDSLSMSAVAIPPIRAEIASIRLSNARRFTTRILKLRSVAQVRHLLEDHYRKRNAVALLLQNAEKEPAG